MIFRKARVSSKRRKPLLIQILLNLLGCSRREQVSIAQKTWALFALEEAHKNHAITQMLSTFAPIIWPLFLFPMLIRPPCSPCRQMFGFRAKQPECLHQTGCHRKKLITGSVDYASGFFGRCSTFGSFNRQSNKNFTCEFIALYIKDIPVTLEFEKAFKSHQEFNYTLTTLA